eukprot:scaffold12863_cov31-Tisochrysis_lutea.AAC.2
MGETVAFGMLSPVLRENDERRRMCVLANFVGAADFVGTDGTVSGNAARCCCTLMQLVYLSRWGLMGSFAGRQRAHWLRKANDFKKSIGASADRWRSGHGGLRFGKGSGRASALHELVSPKTAPPPSLLALVAW